MHLFWSCGLFFWPSSNRLEYALYQVGSSVGSLVAFIIIYKGTNTADGSPTAVYIAFICIMCMSLGVA